MAENPPKKQRSERERRIYRVTLLGTAVNGLLIVLKLFAGIVGRSSALVADAIHSLSDFVTDAIVLIFVRIAGKPRDVGHQYGHGKYETLATLIIGLMLIGAGIGLLLHGADLVIRSLRGEILPRPGIIALVIAVVSIIAKEWLYRRTVRVGRETDSPAVMANAWHHRSDAISSAGTVVGVGGAIFLGEKMHILDPLAAVVVSIFIIKSGYDVMRTSVGDLLDASLPESQRNEILSIITSIPGIVRVHNLRTRHLGNGIAVDFHAKMNGDMSLSEAHAIATQAEQAIKARFGQNAIINVHMEPLPDATKQK